MATGYPYFKFNADNWLTGDIVFEDFAVQGFFTNICALYWKRDGNITLDDIKKRYKGKFTEPELEALQNNFFLVDQNGKISIEFLDEQLADIDHISLTNSKNGSLGGRPKKGNKPTANRPQSEPKAKKSNKDKIRTRQDKEEDKTEVASKVFLTENEILKSKEYFIDYYDSALAILSNYKHSSGKNYKSDYHALIGWVAGRISEQMTKTKNNGKFTGTNQSKTDATIEGGNKLRTIIENGGLAKNNVGRTGDNGGQVIQPAV